MNKTKPAIIVISSHVMRGTVGNRAAAFALEVMGFPVWCVPTVTLPWHPGHGPSSRSTPDDDKFSTMLDELGQSKWIDEVGAVLTGYLGSSSQVSAVAKLLEKIKSRNDVLYTLDPVIGDGGSLYVPEEQANGIKQSLLPLADIVTPNRFELGWLAGSATPQTQEECITLSRSLGPEIVLTTSAPALMRGSTGNLLWRKNSIKMAEHRAIDGPPNGLGDLTAALMTGHLLNGSDAADASAKTTESVFEVMMQSAHAGSDELALERNIESLMRPKISVQMRDILIRKPRV